MLNIYCNKKRRNYSLILELKPSQLNKPIVDSTVGTNLYGLRLIATVSILMITLINIMVARDLLIRVITFIET